MAKLHGLTMGLDVCATFHMGIAPDTLHDRTERIVERAAPAYLMAVAGNADPMLGYLTTSFREHPRLRRRAGKQIASAMRGRLTALGIADDSPDAGKTAMLYAMYAKAGGDRRSSESLRDEGARKLRELRRRGYDLGGDDGDDHRARLDAIYRQARRALYATLDQHVIDDVSPLHARARTRAVDREDYLAHPPSGERLREEDVRIVAALYSSRRPQVQIVISDGLNADAVNEQVRALLPPLRRRLTDAGCHVGEIDVVIENGRVRAGYHAGGIVDATIVVHLIGERPGSGLNTMSAYLTYGRDEAGQPRWRADLDHACTTAVCGIHPRGKTPAAAVDEIARTIGRMLDQRRSGVGLVG